MTIFAKNLLKRIVLVIVMMSILLTFFAVPSSYAKLTIEEGKFYYSGTTKGTYVASEGIFSWLVSALGDIADWLIGLMTLGFRMVFVGWTALIERLLTRALETTIERTETREELVDNATDLSKLTSSTDNVTVEAIVYNRVPALDINIFKNGFDPAISGTGQELVCEVCKKSVKDCCDDTTYKCKDECKCTEKDNCCEPCRQYAAALKAQEGGADAGTSIVDLLRNEIAKWYYLIRLFSFAAMLVILIAIGIKMAFTSIAADKAFYKRMLVDWLVGFVIIVSIHYVMLFIIMVNETLVSTISNVAEQLNADRMRNLSLMTLSEEAGVSEYTDQELEIKVYEEIRTRAYDAKLTVGLPGLILYITLVFFAIRYTVVYLKRYLTIMILTLMGPALGVAYAFQKVFHGKSPSLSKWLKEYIMNVLIQTVHAILYAIFIAQALVLALDSLGGMVIGLVMMNYALKADKMFRKIFNMGGNGSLLDQTADAGNPENMKQPFNAVKAYIKADATKELGKTLLNTPYAKAVKSLAVTAPAAAITGAAVGAKKVADVTGLSRGLEKAKDAIDERLDYEIDKTDIEGYTDMPIRKLKVKVMKKLRGKTNDPELNDAIHLAAQEVLNAKTPEEQEKALEKYNKAKQERDRTISRPTTLRIAGVRLTRAIDVRNSFLIGHNGNSGLKTFRINRQNGEGRTVSAGRGVKTTLKNTYENVRAIKVGLFGSRSVDPGSGELISDKNGMLYNFSLRGLANLDDSDVKKLKDLLKKGASGSLYGTAAMFVGLGTFVAHPKIGLSLLATGAYKYHSAFGLRAPDTKDYKNRNRHYDFSRFSNGSVNCMRQNIAVRYASEIERVATAYATGSKKMINQIEGDLRLIADMLSRDAMRRRFTRVKTALNPKLLAQKANEKRLRMIDGSKRVFTGFKTGISELNQNVRQDLRNIKNFKRTPSDKKLKGPKVRSLGIFDTGYKPDYTVAFLYKEGDAIKKRRPYTRLGVQYAKMMKSFEEDIDDYYSPVFDEANRVSRASKDYANKIKAIQGASDDIEAIQILYQHRRLEKRFARAEKLRKRREAMFGAMDKRRLIRDKYGRIVLKNGGINEEMPKLTEGDLNFAGLRIKGNRRVARVTAIDEAFSRAVLKVSNGQQINLKNEATYQLVLKEFERDLKSRGILEKGQAVGTLFKKGKLRKTFETKMGYTNKKIQTLDRFLDRTMSKEDAANVKAVLFCLMSEKGFGKDLSQITAAEILDRMQDLASGKITIDPKDGSVRFSRDGDREYRGGRTYTEEEKKKLAIIEKYLGALKDENGEFGLLVDTLRRDKHYLDGRNGTQGVLERMLAEEYSRVGSSSAVPQFKIASIRDFDARNITAARLSPDFTRQVNTEIQAAIATMMISRNGKVNVRDKKQFKELTDEITSRLREQGLITGFQEADVIFKKGALATIVQEQVRYIGSKPERLQEFMKLTGVGQRVRIEGATESDFDRANMLVGILNEKNIGIVNKEIQATLAEVLADGEKIDTKNAEQFARIVERLTTRLKEKGIMESYQDSAEVIFKPGRLEEVIDKQVEFITRRPNGLQEFLLIAGAMQHTQMRKATVEDLEPMTPTVQNGAPEEVVKQIDLQIQATVVEMVARSSDGTLDVSNKKEYRRVVEELTRRLVDRGIISSSESASELFKPGKLEEIVESQVSVAISNPEETRAMARDMATETTDDTQFVLELDTRDLAEDVADDFSPDAIIRLNVEIQAALADIAEEGTIDIQSRRTRKRVVEGINERLRDAGILDKDERVEEIVKPESLERILEEESALTNAKMSALERFLDTALTDDEKRRVRQVVSGLSDTERRFSSAEDIYDQAMADVPMTAEERRERERMFAEEAEARGFTYDAETHKVEETRTLTDVQQEIVDRYDQFLIEIYSDQGMIYDPKTGTVREDPSKKKSKKTNIEPEATLEAQSDTELTAADYAVVQAEMEAIIEEMAITGRLDVSSEKSKDEVMRRLSERAKVVGLIEPDERITDLFTRGSLERVYKNEGTRAQNEVEARRRVVEAELGTTQSKGVMSTIASLVEEKKKVDPEAIVDQIMPVPESVDGRPPSTPERDRKAEVIGQVVDLGQEKKRRVEAIRDIAERAQARQREATAAEREEKMAVIEEYTASMGEAEETSRRARRISDVTDTPSDGGSTDGTPLTRKQKLEQIMDAKIDEIIQAPTSASGLLEDILRSSPPTSQEEGLYMKQKVAIVRDFTVAVGKKVRKELKEGQIPMSAELFGAEGVLRKAEQMYGRDSVQAEEARKKCNAVREAQIQKITAERVRQSGITGGRRAPTGSATPRVRPVGRRRRS